MELKQVQISESLEGIARVGVAFFKQLTNGPSPAAFISRFEGLADELRQSMSQRRPSEVEAVTRIRKLYRLVGVDPTKDRPRSENLLRRVLQRKPLPLVNCLVDVVSYTSLELQCPLGIYDWDQIVPPVLVRIGRPEEGYQGIGGDWVRLGGRLVLGDGEGLFGNASHDSERTQVSARTVRALLVAWAPAEAPRSFLESVLREIQRLAAEFCSAKVSEVGIL
jgi:DNA/RNA-binding domain of Phe-tRNA-synthetase-like protein